MSHTRAEGWSRLAGVGLLGLIPGAALAQSAEPAAVSAGPAPAVASPSSPSSFRPLSLALQPTYDYESVYAPPEPMRESEGVNQGGVHFDFTFAYLTDYVFRGFDRSEALQFVDPLALPPPEFDPDGNEDSPNLQFDATLQWDLGKAPHPFIGLFANVYDSDPVSEFQEIRPFFGAEWTIRPLIFTVGQNTYIFPDRRDFDTSEVFGQLQIDDSYFFRTDDPILSPYLFVAYDYDLFDGLYFEAGVEHAFELEDWGIVLTAHAHVAYVYSNPQFDPLFSPVSDLEDPEDTGFQHYQIGLTGSYGLNPLLGIPQRYGDWRLEGYLYYTDGLDNNLLADTQIWGGAGIGFRY